MKTLKNRNVLLKKVLYKICDLNYLNCPKHLNRPNHLKHPNHLIHLIHPNHPSQALSSDKWITK